MNATASQIRCGNHPFGEKTYHASTAEVRACYAGTLAAPTTPASREVLNRLAAQTSPFAKGPRMATEKMQGYATSLRSTREGGEEFSAYPVELTFEQAKHIIEALKDAPRVGQAPEPQLPAAQPWKALAAQVPDGRYAVRYEGDKAHFYRVSRKANGFVKLQEQASDSWFEKRLAEYTKIFEAITKAGVENAGRLYGELIGECRRCGRALTDEHNPYKGIGYGPDCGAKA
jgi:hypothetical protein